MTTGTDDERYIAECGRIARQTKLYDCAKCGKTFSMWCGSPYLGLCDPCMGKLEIH